LILNNDHRGDIGALATDGELATRDPDASLSWDFPVTTPGKTTIWAEHAGRLLGDLDDDGDWHAGCAVQWGPYLIQARYELRS
jgi:hypothetical protein